MIRATKPETDDPRPTLAWVGEGGGQILISASHVECLDADLTFPAAPQEGKSPLQLAEDKYEDVKQKFKA